MSGLKSSQISRKLSTYSQDEKTYHLDAWEKSGLKISEYARQSGVSKTSLRSWKQIAEASKPMMSFKQAKSSTTKSSVNMTGAIDIFLPSDIKLRIHDATLLGAILPQLKSNLP